MTPARIALSAGLGALAVGFGVALMATAGYLISRAAEQPPILALGTTIVAVRFFGLGRPLLRYLDRLASHDLALRLARADPHPLLRADRAARAGRARGLPARRAARSGWSATWTCSKGLYLRCLGPPLVAVAVAAVVRCSPPG